MTDLPLAIAVGILFFSVLGAMALHAWVTVSIRRCECSEEIARIENGAAPKTIGFSR